MKTRNLTLFISLLLSFSAASAQLLDLNTLNSEQSIEPVYAGYLLKTDNKPDQKLNFSEFSNIELPQIQAKKGTHIIKFDCKGNDNSQNLWLKFPYLNCESISAAVYTPDGRLIRDLEFRENSSNYVLPIPHLDVDTFSIVLKIRSSFPLFVPARFMVEHKLELSEKRDDLIYSMYFGIIIIMCLYNIFVYVSTRSKSYIYYVFYTLTFGIAQFILLGYLKAIFPGVGLISAKQSAVIFFGLSGIFGIWFFISFLEARKNLPIIYKIFLFLAISYSLLIVSGFLKLFGISFNLLNINGLLVGLVGIGGSGYLAYKGNRPARFFLIAWVTFIVGLVIFVLTQLGMAPYNEFTKFVLPMGSAIEVSLLSFALADKINILQQENETLVREQNIILEKQVAERTAELGDALDNLKNTQLQLVNSEKMASLGHLTAGIAHEINNPINFISANVSPLRRDIEDYEMLMDMYNELEPANFDSKIEEIRSKVKEVDLEYLKKEIQTLLSGIDEGARRTAEIVKNLKIFSHIDKAEHSYYSVNEGLRSTLQLLTHKLGGIYIRENLGDLPPILCFPGKLNQVFMNILSNAIDALAGRPNPEIGVHTYLSENNVYVEISDNGTGIPENIINDIFNPFFTTKEVGTGTGLGLSITIAIVQEHGGDIKVKSEPGKGTTFIIILPVRDEKIS